MIGHLVSLLQARVESPLPGEEYLENESLLSNTSQCRGRLSEDSELVLKRLIFEEKKQLIYLQLNSTLFNTIQANVSEILFPSKWVWVTNDAGRPLLELDFRYDAYSLTTLSLDVGEMMTDIEMQNKDEGLDYNELLSLVRCSIHDATKHETTPHYSVCHSTLSTYDKTGYTYYLQFRCCGMPSQKFNSQENQLSNHTCQVLETDRGHALFVVVALLLYLVSHLLIRLLHVSEDNYRSEDNYPVTQNEVGIDDGEKDSMTSVNHEAQTNTATCMLYVNFDSSTPLRITHPIRYILQLQLQNTWICRIRRFGFFAVYPCVIYMMMAVDAAKHPKFIQMLCDVEKELDVVILDVELFDRLWLFRPRFDVIFHVSVYTLMTIIISMTDILEDVLSLLVRNNDEMGLIKLPPHLCRQHESKDGLLLLYEKMIHRFSLIWEPKFWKYWVVHTFTKPSCEHPLPKDLCLCLLRHLRRVTVCVLSLLWLFPVFNLICITDANVNHWTFLRVTMLWLLMIVGHLPVFALSCATLAKSILYTIKGTVKHYTKTLPLVSIIVVIVYYIVRTMHRLEKKYKNMKKVTFDECISLQKDLDDGHANFRLVVYRADGIPKIPKVIYDQIIEKHLPLRKSEFFAFIKLLLIVIFLVYVGITVDAFKITNATTLGQTIATFFAFTLPKLFEFFDGQDQIEAERMKFQIRETVKKCLGDTEALNIDAATTVRTGWRVKHIETSV